MRYLPNKEHNITLALFVCSTKLSEAFFFSSSQLSCASDGLVLALPVCVSVQQVPGRGFGMPDDFQEVGCCHGFQLNGGHFSVSCEG